MPRIGFHASHEQFSPAELLHCVQAAERAGFDAAMSSDHFAPWSERQGQSGFAWSWLGAAMQATRLPFGVIAVPGGWRYHPAVVAQAAATLQQMFPDRLAWIGAGSGEAVNERIVGQGWPAKAVRHARLEAAVEIIRALWAGETVSRLDGPIRIEETRLYCRPARPPRILGAALTEETARWLGRWADGLVTVNRPRATLRRLIDAFREGGGAGKPLCLQVHLSYAESDMAARRNAHGQWRVNALPSAILADLPSVAQLEAAGALVRPEDLEGSVRISADLERHGEWLQEDLAMGFAEIQLHNVGRNQRAFIEAFGERVLPALRRDG